MANKRLRLYRSFVKAKLCVFDFSVDDHVTDPIASIIQPHLARNGVVCCSYAAVTTTAFCPVYGVASRILCCHLARENELSFGSTWFKLLVWNCDV